MSVLTSLTYSPIPHETKTAKASSRRPKASVSITPKHGAEMKCAAPKSALPLLSPYKL